jgi:hypothetical protein
LWRLNFEEENRLTCIKEIEKYIKEKKPRLSQQGISKFTSNKVFLTSL